jgi:hypothetical protein
MYERAVKDKQFVDKIYMKIKYLGWVDTKRKQNINAGR